MMKTAQELDQSCNNLSKPLQNFSAAQIFDDQAELAITQLPTGNSKTYIAALLALIIKNLEKLGDRHQLELPNTKVKFDDGQYEAATTLFDNGENHAGQE